MVDKKNTQSQKSTPPAQSGGSKNSASALISIGVGIALVIVLVVVYVKNQSPENVNAQPEQQNQIEKIVKDTAGAITQTASVEPQQRTSQRVQQPVTEPAQKTPQPKAQSVARSLADQQPAEDTAVSPAASKSAPASSSGQPASTATVSGARTRPYTINADNFKTVKVAPITVAQLRNDNPNKYKPVTVADLVPQRKPLVPAQLDPEVAKALEQARAEEKLSRSEPLELPAEFAGEDVASVGQASFPDGSRWFIVYNEQGNPVKILEVAADGARLVKELNSQGNVVSITQDGKRQVFIYEPLDAGKTQVTVLDDAGKQQEVRTYSDRGLLVAMKEQSGQSFNYSYSFKQGAPTEYTKQTASGKTVKQGSYADIESMQFNNLRVFATGMVTMYSYAYREDGSIKEIIENKDKENEVVRTLDVEGRVTSVLRKITGETFIYKYDEGNIVEVIIVAKDGSRRSIDRSSAEFALLESETDLFDPVVFSETIKRHKDMQKYLSENRRQKVIADAQRAQNLATADSFKGPAQAAIKPVQKVQSAKAFKAPAKAPAKPISVPR